MNADGRGKTNLNKRLMRQWLRGQKAMNKITQAERRTRLREMTWKQAREIFDELHQGGDN